MNHPVNLILSVGTRIITRNDANRIGGGQLVAASAVAVITEPPLDASELRESPSGETRSALNDLLVRVRLAEEDNRESNAPKKSEHWPCGTKLARQPISSVRNWAG